MHFFIKSCGEVPITRPSRERAVEDGQVGAAGEWQPGAARVRIP